MPCPGVTIVSGNTGRIFSLCVPSAIRPRAMTVFLCAIIEHLSNAMTNLWSLYTLDTGCIHVVPQTIRWAAKRHPEVMP
jgi:hypothetical protein